MENVLSFLAVLFIVGSAVLYLVKQKKRGVRCVGCPSAGSCCKCQKNQAIQPKNS